MLMTKERRPAVRTLRGWAIGVLQEAGAILECEEHGWAKDRADPHARARVGCRPAGAAGRLVPGSGCRGSLRGLGFDRRYLPGMRLSGLLRLRRDGVVALFVDEVQ
jgi:hypothetical protein